MKSLSNILAFARVAETQSFYGAALVMGLSTSAVSKAVARLEAELGVKLLHRTTRSISLTPDGVRFYEGCQRLLLELDELTAEIQGNQETPKGRLTISVPVALGRMCLVSAFGEFMQKFPEINLEVSFDDRSVDLAEKGIDVIIRTGTLADSANIIAQRILTYPLLVCGTEDYLARYGKPEHPQELEQHNCLNFRNRDSGRTFPWFFSIDGKVERFNVNGNLVFDDGEAVGRAACSGIGLSQMPAFMAASAIHNGVLEEVLQPYRPDETSVWVAYLDRRFVSSRIRVFVDFINSYGKILRSFF